MLCLLFRCKAVRQPYGAYLIHNPAYLGDHAHLRRPYPAVDLQIEASSGVNTMNVLRHGGYFYLYTFLRSLCVICLVQVMIAMANHKHFYFLWVALGCSTFVIVRTPELLFHFHNFEMWYSIIYYIGWNRITYNLKEEDNYLMYACSITCCIHKSQPWVGAWEAHVKFVTKAHLIDPAMSWEGEASSEKALGIKSTGGWSNASVGVFFTVRRRRRRRKKRMCL